MLCMGCIINVSGRETAEIGFGDGHCQPVEGGKRLPHSVHGSSVHHICCVYRVFVAVKGAMAAPRKG